MNKPQYVISWKQWYMSDYQNMENLIYPEFDAEELDGYIIHAHIFDNKKLANQVAKKLSKNYSDIQVHKVATSSCVRLV